MKASVNIPLWPAIASGLLYAASLNGIVIPTWLILLPLFPYAILAAAGLAILVLTIVIALIESYQNLSK
jgi:hypothetical protein